MAQNNSPPAPSFKKTEFPDRSSALIEGRWQQLASRVVIAGRSRQKLNRRKHPLLTRLFGQGLLLAPYSSILEQWLAVRFLQ